ncbi:MAG TPA: hypothetical protein VLE48_00385 [Terriglobales bacterium]|nr:hypothetical protein [Terriglobales bacterium]
MTFSRRTYLILAIPLVAALIWAGTSLAAAPDALTVPAGTALHVRLDHSLATNQVRSGDMFTATVSQPVVVDGNAVIPEGARARGLVTYVKQSGRLKGVAQMQLALDAVQVGDQWYDVRTSGISRVGGNHKKRNILLIGGGGGGGALIGALAAGGKGALIGGPIGAGAGIAVAALTGKKDFRLPAETPLQFRLMEPVSMPPVKS